MHIWFYISVSLTLAFLNVKFVASVDAVHGLTGVVTHVTWKVGVVNKILDYILAMIITLRRSNIIL